MQKESSKKIVYMSVFCDDSEGYYLVVRKEFKLTLGDRPGHCESMQWNQVVMMGKPVCG